MDQAIAKFNFYGLKDVFTRLLTTAQRSETEGVPGREIFNEITADLSRHFWAIEDPVNLSERLRTFHIPEGETFEVCCHKLFALLDEIKTSQSTTKKAINLSYIMDYIRENVGIQFPYMTILLYPETLLHVDTPYPSTDALRRRFEMLYQIIRQL